MPQHPSRTAIHQAIRYLKSCGIRLPDYKQTFSDKLVGGAEVSYEPLQLTMGNYPTTFTRNWFAMHEIGHLLWAEHQPLRHKAFRKHFGDPTPEWDEYEKIYKRDSWKTAATHQLSWRPGPHRPSGQPSHYGANAGGEERFCELIGLIYANGDFSKDPPVDLEELWDACWSDGLARMI